MENRIDQLKYYISVLQNILKEFRMNTNVETIIKSYESKKSREIHTVEY